MPQIVIALLVIFYFLAKLFWQNKKRKISKNEFLFWLFFWLAALGIILFLKPLDRLVSMLGFSASAIQVLLYISVAALFYFIFSIRLRLEKMDENITKLTEDVAINQAKK